MRRTVLQGESAIVARRGNVVFVHWTLVAVIAGTLALAGAWPLVIAGARP